MQVRHGLWTCPVSSEVACSILPVASIPSSQQHDHVNELLAMSFLPLPKFIYANLIISISGTGLDDINNDRFSD